MRGLIAVLSAAVTLLAVSASAAAERADATVPAGFTANPYLSQVGSFVAGKPVTDYCAASDTAFQNADIAATGDGGEAGFSYPGGNQSFLNAWVCGYLARWKTKKPVNPDHLAQAILTVVHESEHLTGVTDESIADCRALAAMPKVIARFFPLRKVYSLHIIMRDAWDAHDGESEQYLENCPTR